MKDAYSFDADDAGLDASYDAMAEAYHNTLLALRLGCRNGGSRLWLYRPAKTRQSLLYSPQAAKTRVLILRFRLLRIRREPGKGRVRKVPPTQLRTRVNSKNSLLQALKQSQLWPNLRGVCSAKTAKAVFYAIDDQVYVVVIRGD